MIFIFKITKITLINLIKHLFIFLISHEFKKINRNILLPTHWVDIDCSS